MWLLVFLAGCYTPPKDLPLIDEIPIVAPEGCAPPREERVACVIDGDTLDLTTCGAERVRLLGINAPEVAHEDEPADCWGDEAELELRRVVAGELVSLTFDEECQGVYGRTLAYVWLGGDEALDLIEEDPSDEFEWDETEGELPVVMINEWLVSRGFARVYDEDWKPVSELRLGSRLVEAESRAQSQQLGLWGNCEEEKQ